MSPKYPTLQCAYDNCRKQFLSKRRDQVTCPNSPKCSKGFKAQQLRGETRRYEGAQAKAQRKLWELGELSFLVRPNQQRIWEFLQEKWRDPGCYRANLLCNRRRGKTSVLWLFIETLCRTIPGFTVLFVAPTRAELLTTLDTVLPALWDTCPEDLRPQVKGYRNKYVYPNGSTIHLAGTDRKRGGKLRGKGANLIVFDEPGQSEADLTELWGAVLYPIVHSKQGKVFYLSTPSDSPGHSYFDIYSDCDAEGNNLTLTIYDQGLPEAELEEMARQVSRSFGQKDTKWQREYGCRWVTEQDRKIIKEWTPEYIQELPIPAKDKYFHLWQRYVSIDPGFKDFTAMLFAYYHYPSKVLYVEDEVILMNEETGPQIIQAKDAKMQELWGDLKLSSKPLGWMDGEHRLVKEMTYAGSLIKVTDKESLEVMVDKVRAWVDHKRIVISPRCKILADTLLKGIWQRQTEQSTSTRKFSRLRGLGHLDALAALVYLVRNVGEHTDPVPKFYGYDPEKHMPHIDLIYKGESSVLTPGNLFINGERDEFFDV